MEAGELCTRTVAIIRKDADVVEAARRMRAHHVGTLVVVDPAAGGMRPVGIVTDRDLTVTVLGEDLPERARAVNVGDIMSCELVTARESDDVESVLKKMRVHGVRRVPVVDDAGRLESRP